MTLQKIFATAVVSSLLVGVAWAAPKPVQLDPINHQNAALQLPMPDGTVVSYTPAELENFPTYRVETATPWRETPAVFEGILLTDLLAAHGLLNAPAINVLAENDYATLIEREVWESAPILIATRVDGRPHSRRNRGPIQFVVDQSDYDENSVLNEGHLVWMAAKIQVGE